MNVDLYVTFCGYCCYDVTFKFIAGIRSNILDKGDVCFSHEMKVSLDILDAFEDQKCVIVATTRAEVMDIRVLHV